MRLTQLRLPALFTCLLLSGATALSACGGGDTTSGSPTGAGGSDAGGGVDGGAVSGAVSPAGELSFTVDNKPVKIDYGGGIATVQMVHKKVTDASTATCVTSVEISVSRPDGTCELLLQFGVGVASEKELVDAKFYAVKAIKQAGTVLELKPCAVWPGAESAKDEVVFSLSKGEGTLNSGIVAAPESGQDQALLKGKKFAPSGKVTLANGGKQIVVDLDAIKISGDVVSTGSAMASCGTVTGVAKCKKTSGEGGNKVGDQVKRKVGLTLCGSTAEYDIGELCGNEAIWITTHRRWSKKACGGCAKGETCYKVVDDVKKVWTPTCGAATSDCASGCGDKHCVKGMCYEKVADGADMSLKDALAAYSQIHEKASKDVKLAAVFVVLEGETPAKGTCTKKEDGTSSCTGDGPPANDADCEAARKEFQIPDDVTLLFDPNGKLWASNTYFGPEYYGNGMFITNSELTITHQFPVPGAPPPTPEQVISAIKEAADL